MPGLSRRLLRCARTRMPEFRVRAKRALNICAVQISELVRRFTKMRKELFGDQDAFYNQEKPKFRFKREDGPSS
eukprot:scaffold300216_cov23-Tisochrysis_lutea.AAC.1